MAFAACAAPARLVTATAFDFMDTLSTIKLYERDAAAAQRLFDRCRELDSLVDMHKPSSEIGRLNAANGAAVTISPDTQTLLNIGIEAARISGGLLDITIGPVSSLWDFTNGNSDGSSDGTDSGTGSVNGNAANSSAIPDETTLTAALSRVGISNLTVDDGSASITGGGLVDLGALAKGYALDIVEESLTQQGIANALVNLGGSVLTRGVQTDGKPWRVGLQEPFGDANALIGVIVGSNMKIVTAGVYERSFELDGLLYHHILDPRTGFPVQTDVLSAAIIADSGVWADAYSTICVLLGSSKALEFIESKEGAECILALEDGSILTSSGIGTKVTFERARAE
ncbi:thiamine biosynthesis lipoprotein ApbE [Clostridia bacterium]|nr:thiamine biosynthesis lipoprotein ApbE [Clostridia bacterium]